MAHSLTEAEVHSIVSTPVDGLVAAETGQHRLPGCGEIGGQGTIKLTLPKFMLHPTGTPGLVQALPVLSVGLVLVYDFLVDVDGSVLMQTENVGVFRFEHRVVVNSPGVAEIEFFGYRVPEVRVYEPATRHPQRGGRTWQTCLRPQCSSR